MNFPTFFLPWTTRQGTLAAGVRACLPPSGPGGEGRLARALRWSADRDQLAELDGHLLRDVGLTRQDVERGLPFNLPRHPWRNDFRLF